MKKIRASLFLAIVLFASPALAGGGIDGRSVTSNPLSASTEFSCLNDSIGTGDDQKCTGLQLLALFWNNASFSGNGAGDKQILLKDHGVIYSSSGLSFNSSTGTLSVSNVSAPSTGSLNLLAGASGAVNWGVSGSTYGILGQSRVAITPTTSSTAATKRFSFTAAADTSLTAGTEATIGVFDMSATRQHALNTGIAAERLFRFIPGTESFAGGVGTGTITDAATVGIAGGPTGGTNAKITNSHGLYISTISYTSVANGYGMTVNAPTGATNNYAANLGGVKFDSAGNVIGAKSYAVTAGNAGPYTVPAYVATRFYLGGPLGAGTTATNTTPLVDGTEYATLGVVAAPVSIHSIALRTSSSNASSGASIKVCIYAADGASGKPSTLLGGTASGTSVGDAAVSTDYDIALDANTTVGPGPFWVAILQGSTTGARFVESTGVTLYDQVTGNAANSTLFAGTGVIYGYTGTQAYASGCASPFGTATANNTVGLNPAFAFEIH